MNTRIEKVCNEIAKTKARVSEYQVKLRDLEKQKIALENEEIVALFRREKLTEDELYELLQSQKNKGSVVSSTTMVTRGDTANGKIDVEP